MENLKKSIAAYKNIISKRNKLLILMNEREVR
jgi:hypothetical protein